MGAYTRISINIYLYTYPFIHFSDSFSLEITMISSGIHKISPVFFGFPWPHTLREASDRPCFTAWTSMATAAFPGGTWPLSMTGHGRGKRLAKKSCLEMAAGDADTKWMDLPWIYHDLPMKMLISGNLPMEKR